MADSPTKLYSQLSAAAPNLNPAVLQKALAASSCAVAHGVASPERLAVIDFSLPSSERRLWLFDLAQGNLILRDLVAHGKNSGMETATSFSNNNGSYQSSIGLFRASESYRGSHGYSLRLDGLEPGVNDLARERAIVIHGADYVDPSWVAEYGRIGRSHGCPAVSQGAIREVVDSLKGGQLVFSYYPDPQWLSSSTFLNCDAGAQVAGLMSEEESSGG
nr:murein L,D-transpeptidase catalytic domain family protein [Marinobacter salinexigens]